MTRISGAILTISGLLMLSAFGFEFGLSQLVAWHSQEGMLGVFKTQAQTTQLGSPSATLTEGTPVALLKIPSLGVTQVVVEGSSAADLETGPGHLSVSPLPGEFGNSVLLGRRTTYGAPLRDLNRLRSGSVISVTTGQGTFVYSVRSVGTVAPDDIAPMKGTLDSRLTLITSDPPYLFTKRLVAVAMLQGLPIDVPTRTAPSISASDLGLAANPIWFAPAFVLLQLLVGSLLVTAWMRRRYWPVSVTYMFAGPVIVALTLATVMVLDRALPGTM